MTTRATPRNWNNTYEQWTAAQALQSYLVHGGPPKILRNLAKYSECDVKGTLAKFDTNHNGLIEYTSGTLPGNDADSVAFQQYGTRGRRTARRRRSGTRAPRRPPRSTRCSATRPRPTR